MGEFIKDANNVTSFDVDQSDEISQPCCVLPTQTLDDPNILVESSYYEEIGQHELLQLDINWGNKDDEEEEDDGDVDGDGDEEDDDDEDEDDCYGGDG
ncbi:PREDICTED: calsequestrin-1-like [Populus euphratica]|uniref:Calsequestrin-1-like n=1 Tax=Populus euphratica TaxID=75702 RepID=A0AAJ6TR44_POPEU|nr:PREDICTED: calsequestrin-1-like [Populus euphratica]